MPTVSSISLFSLAQEETNEGYDERDNKIFEKNYPFDLNLSFSTCRPGDLWIIQLTDSALMRDVDGSWKFDTVEISKYSIVINLL